MKGNPHAIRAGEGSRWSDLLRLSAGQPALLAQTLVATLVAQAGMVGSLALGGWLIGLVLTDAPASLWQPVAAAMLACALAGAGGRWWQAHVSHVFAFHLIETLQVGSYEGLERAAPDVQAGVRRGEQANVALNDAQALEHFFAHTLTDAIGAVLVPLLALLALAAIQPWLTLALLPFLAALASVPFWLGGRALRQGRAMNEALAGLNAEVLEGIEARREILLFNQEAAWHARLGRLLARLRLEQRRYALRSGAEQGVIELIQALALVSALACGAWLLQIGLLDLAQLPLAVMLVGAALLPMADVAREAGQLGAVRASAGRVLGLLRQPPRVRDQGCQQPQGARLEFDQVRFSHGGRPVLQGVDFLVRPGEMVALVGASGAGKTTCANLLMRFYDVEGGAIRVGGVDVRDIPLAGLRQGIAWVGQDAYLFDDSIEGNLRLARPDATAEEIEAAARQAQAHDFIQALPEGYQTRCGEGGARLSGGQRQRIAIARALLSQAPVLVMDEASSSLDAHSEHALQQALLGLRGQRTLLLIAHRPSTIAQADRVVLLEDGQVRDQGTHSTLLARCDAYARLLAQPTQ